MELNAEKREKIGKQSKSLKAEGKIPAVIFGRDIESTAISVNTVDATKVFSSAGETSLIDIKLGNDTIKVLVKNAQFDPIKGGLIHLEFYKPNLKEIVSASIPVEVIGEENNALVKSGNAVVLTLLNEIEVEALPMNLPRNFTIDISKLENVGDGITVAELEYNKELVEIVGAEAEAVVVKLDAPQEEEVEEAVSEEDAIAKVEATGEKKPEEGEEDEEK